MCVKPITIKNQYRSQKSDSHILTVPCGKCVECINKTRTEWAFRLQEEARNWSTAYFITLTYSTDQLPFLNLETGEYPVRIKDNTEILAETDRIEKIVYKKDVQEFLKIVRRKQEYFHNKINGFKYKNRVKETRRMALQCPRLSPYYKHALSNYKNYHAEKRIRFYASSEYGTEYTKRPHYHIILFNLEPYIANQIELQKVWKRGMADIKPIDKSVGTYYYLTKYLYKQRNMKALWTFKPFSLMSTKPFIGYSYVERAKQYHIRKQNLLTKFNEREIILPRVYHTSFPRYLLLNTRKIIEQREKQNEITTFNKTHKQNHHPDILKIFQSIRKQDKYNRELQHFQTLVKQ